MTSTYDSRSVVPAAKAAVLCSSGSRESRSKCIVAVLLYDLAKVGEHFDKQIFALTGGVVSGHTLKHLLAAAAIGWLLRMLMKRAPIAQFR
jgi:hypothetical protein